MSHTIAIFPGSFDPFTRGHQALVDDALRIFDKVVIGIGNNVSKAGLLRIEARKQLIKDLYADNPRVEVRIYTVADIASSTVREVLAFGRTVDEFMPEGIDIKKYL